MAGFTDKGGHRWPIVLDAAAVDRVRAATGVDLTPDPATGLQGLGRALESAGRPAVLVDALHAACLPDAVRRGLTRGQFGRLLHGEVIDQATDAFMTAVVDSVPQQFRRRLMREWNLVAVTDYTKR